MLVPWRVTTGNEMNEASSSPNDFEVIYICDSFREGSPQVSACCTHSIHIQTCDM